MPGTEFFEEIEGQDDPENNGGFEGTDFVVHNVQEVDAQKEGPQQRPADGILHIGA